ncbi:aspartate kinase [Leptodontidium sp. MPI-SDFR-AT-0119]|nr:aspartate kinase [Leptodontidium sp. MPI-SDFR-AT-0119]
MPLLFSPKPWIVQKYGGTSLGKLLFEITSSIIPSYLEHSNVAVVCSAISGTEKSKGTTSLLIKAIDCAMNADREGELRETIDVIRDEHLVIIQEMRSSAGKVVYESVFEEVEVGIRRECEELRGFLSAAQTIGELSPRSKDRVVATGEKLACLVVVAALMSKGINATLVSLHDIVAAAYGEDQAQQKSAYDDLGPRFFDALVVEIGHRIESCGDSVPVITGFFGLMPNSMLRSVGRGYSDLCAAMTSVSLSASELQIWKEVDGIFTADPRKISSARLLATITLEEASELTYYGSEVIHPFTMDQIRQASIPLRLKNVKNPSGSGTIIYPSPSGVSTPSTVSVSASTSTTPPLNAFISNTNTSISSFMSANGYYGTSQSRRAPTALTTKDSIVLVNIQSNRTTKSHGFLAEVFNRLDALGAVTDLITSSEQSVSLALSGLEDEGEVEVERSLGKCGNVQVVRDVAIVSVIGHKMRNKVGIAGQIFSTLSSGGVNIYLIGQGASEINISLVVKKDDAMTAMDLLHTHVLGIPHHMAPTPLVQNSMMKGPWLY